MSRNKNVKTLKRKKLSKQVSETALTWENLDRIVLELMPKLDLILASLINFERDFRREFALLKEEMRKGFAMMHRHFDKLEGITKTNLEQ